MRKTTMNSGGPTSPAQRNFLTYVILNDDAPLALTWRRRPLRRMGSALRAPLDAAPDLRSNPVDAAPRMVAQALNLLPPGAPIHFQQATAEALPFADGQFDLVFSTMTFHHWADQKKGVSEVARVLAPNGRWLLADFVGRGFVRSITQLFRLHRFFDRKGLDAFIAEAGLAVVTERPSGWLGRSVPVLAIKKVERAMGIEPT